MKQREKYHKVYMVYLKSEFLLHDFDYVYTHMTLLYVYVYVNCKRCLYMFVFP